MPNSIRTTSKTTTPATKQTTFAIGDVVLCPSLSSEPFTLIADQYGQRDLLSLTHDGSYFYYDEQGYFVPASDTETGDYRPNLFHDTPSNRQAVSTLYGNVSPIASPHRKTIDITEAGEDEAVLMSSRELSDTACDIKEAAVIFDNLGDLLCLIYRGKIDQSTAKGLARLAHDSTCTWAELLYSRLEIINEPLEQSKFGKVGA